MISRMENVSWEMFGDGCVGSYCMDTAVARPTTWRNMRNLDSLKYGLGKATYLNLAD
jgi:hypothetical protein